MITNKIKKWGYKDPLFCISNRYKTSAKTPDGFYELIFVDTTNLKSGVMFIDPSYANWHQWKQICEDDDHLYVINNLVRKTRRNTPKVPTNPIIDHVVDADSIPQIDQEVGAVDHEHMRKIVGQHVKDSIKEKEANIGSLFEYA